MGTACAAGACASGRPPRAVRGGGASGTAPTAAADALDEDAVSQPGADSLADFNHCGGRIGAAAPLLDSSTLLVMLEAFVLQQVRLSPPPSRLARPLSPCDSGILLSTAR